MNANASIMAGTDYWEEVYASKQMSRVLNWMVSGVEEISTEGVKTLCLVVMKGRTKGLIPLDQSRIQEAGNRNQTRARMRQFIGQEMSFVVTHILRDEGIFIASRAKAMEQMSVNTWASLCEGIECVAVVRRFIKRRNGDKLNDLGAMVEVEGVEGFLPVNEVSYGWISNIQDFIQPGQILKVKVLKVDPSLNKLVVSLKEVLGDPWPGCLKRYSKGGEYHGIVTGRQEYGIFVALEPGVNVLCKQVKNNPPMVGDQVAVIIHSIYAETQRMTGAILMTKGDTLLRNTSP